MFSLSGELSRVEYFRQLIAAYAIFIGSVSLLLLAIDALNAASPEAGYLRRTAASVIIATLIGGSAVWLFAIFALIVKRARNAGSALRFTAAAILLTPVGFIVIGFIPPADKPRTKKRP